MVRRSVRELFEHACTLPEIFDVVKESVRRHLKAERSGLMLGLSNLGQSPESLVGGFFQVAGNMIVMNTLPLARLQATKPELYKPFAYHVLLHEYLHSIGYLDEFSTRSLTMEISRTHFGRTHPVTNFAHGWAKHLAHLTYPEVGWHPEGDFQVEVVRGLDAGATSYIQ